MHALLPGTWSTVCALLRAPGHGRRCSRLSENVFLLLSCRAETAASWWITRRGNFLFDVFYDGAVGAGRLSCWARGGMLITAVAREQGTGGHRKTRNH